MALQSGLGCILCILPESLEKFVPEALVCRNMSRLDTISIEGRDRKCSRCCLPDRHQLRPHQ
jgi:hypothetical protein